VLGCAYLPLVDIKPAYRRELRRVGGNGDKRYKPRQLYFAVDRKRSRFDGAPTEARRQPEKGLPKASLQ
jgi:hypothetical protein